MSAGSENQISVDLKLQLDSLGADAAKAGGPHVDPALRVAAYWAHCEATLSQAGAGSSTATTQVWDSLLKRPAYAAAAETWLSYALHERSHGGAAAARKVFKRCYARRLDFAAGAPSPGASSGQEAVCIAWLRMEREFGGADDYFAAEAKVRAASLEPLSLIPLPVH